MTSPGPAPSLEGRRVRLDVIEPDHEAWLYRLLSDPVLSFRWGRVSGSFSPQAFRDQIWANVLAQFVIVHRETAVPIGLTSAWRSPTSPSAASIGIILESGVHGLGWPLEGFRLFVDHLFSSFELRKLYADVLDLNLGQYAGAIGPLFEEEGRLRQHCFVAGAFRDVHILAMYRDGWEAYRGARHGVAEDDYVADRG